MKTLKLSLSLLFFFALTFFVHAQQYTLQANTTAFTPLVGGTAVNEIENDQGVSAAVPIGFNFTYFGVVHTSVQATAEGFLTFNNIAGPVLPFDDNQLNSSTYLNIIAPLWDDHHGGGGGASHAVSGSAPNRVFTFEWLNWRWNYQAAAANISFQVRLYETSNVIEFIYRQEPGELVGPTASTGLGGPGINQFYSLSSLSPAPDFSVAGVNTLSTKPNTGQRYAFTPSAIPVLAPTIQAQTVGTSQLAAQTCTLTWANGNGSNHAVFMKQTSAIETAPVVDNTAYTPSTSFASASSLVGSGWYCVYNGTETSAGVVNLQSGVTYRVQVFSYNGLAGQQKYLTTTNATNPVNITTALQAPQSPYSTLAIKRVTGTSVTFDLAEQSGAKRVIFAKQGTNGVVSPVPNTTYTASLTFAAGSQIGASGWFCVFNGTTSGDMTLTGLQGNTGYLLYVVDYNGPAGSEIYALPEGSGILVNVTTYESHAVPGYAFQPSAGSFVPLVGGTAVNSIENDDALSSFIPLGFTFRIGSIPFTQVTASSNGFLSFNPYVGNVGSGLSSELALGNHRPLVAPLWDDLSGVDGQASYLTEGTEPNRVFTFEWLNWRWDYSATSGISFQVKLYESNNRIEYIYRQEPGALSGPSAAIGLSFASTGSGNFISLNNSGAAPTASLSSETSSIAAKPATGQVYSFTPAKMNQSISFAAIADKFFGSSSFNVSASATSGIPVTLQSSNTSVATVSGLTVTLTGVGSVTITASQSGNNAYNPAIDVQRAFIVNKGDQVISFNPTPVLPFSATGVQLTGSSNSGLAVSYESSNPSVATISGSTLTIIGVGSTDITATQAGNANYNAALPSVKTFTVTKATQSITFPGLSTKFANDLPYQLGATSTSGLPVAYESSNTGVATISGATLTIVGAGTANITASQPGNANYDAAGVQIRPLTVTKRPQVITFTTLEQKFVDDAAFSPSASSNSSLAISYQSSNPQVATVSGSTVTIVGAGTTTITALQAGDQFYLEAPSVMRTLTISKRNQSANFTSATPLQKIFGDAPFVLEGNATSGLPAVFSSSNPAVATISGNIVTIVGAGTSSISISQPGNTIFNAASGQSFSLVVQQADQTVVIDPVATKQVDDESFTVTASSNTGLPITFSGSAHISVSGNMVTINFDGRATLYATAAGGPNHLAKTEQLEFCINPPKPKLKGIVNSTLLPDLITLSIDNPPNTYSEYQWFKNGIKMEGGPLNAELPVQVPGVYSLMVSQSNCLSEMSDPYAVIYTGTQDAEKTNFRIFPNPVNDVFTITLPNDREVKIDIVNQLGVKEKSVLRKGTGEISMRGMPAGEYVVRVTDNGQINSIKLIKQ